MMKRAVILAFLAFPASALLAAPGCVADAEGEYEAFAKRAGKGTGGAGGGTTDGGCTPPEPGEIDGDYIFALSATLGPDTPVLFLTTITTSAGADGMQMQWRLQPLAAEDRTTPVGSAIDFEPFTVNSDGTFLADPGPLTVTGEANPITKGNPITADIDLSGEFCGVEDFYCGAVGGEVTSPLTLPLTGSTFTLSKVTTPDTYPEPPPINCAKDLAAPKG
jgi:hypothetical protein